MTLFKNIEDVTTVIPETLQQQTAPPSMVAIEGVAPTKPKRKRTRSRKKKTSTNQTDNSVQDQDSTEIRLR